MTKAIIYKDDKSQVAFCEDGRIYFKSENSRFYIEAKEILKSLDAIKTKGITERKELLNKLISMNYQEAAKFHLENQKSKGRKGKLFEGEYNDK